MSFLNKSKYLFFSVIFSFASLVFINYAEAATCPALGNFQKSNDDSATQNNPKITYDAFTDTRVNSLSRSRPPVQNILEFYSYSWSWAPDKIEARFQLARDYASKTDYIAFLMDEEVVQPSTSWWYAGWRPGFVGAPGFSSSYGTRTFEGVSVDYAAGSATFYTQLLHAWKQLCINLNKKCALVGDAQSDNSFYSTMYSSSGVNYIASSFDMIYLYAYPKTVSQADCSMVNDPDPKKRYYCAKYKIDFWRGKGFTGKINYIVTTEQFGAGSDAVVEADFRNAADNGADIISAYPYKHAGDEFATARLINIWDTYVAEGCTPQPTGTPGPTSTPTPCTPTKTCSDYPNMCGTNLFDGCSNSLDCSGSCVSPLACNTDNWRCEIPLGPPTGKPVLTATSVIKAVELRWNIPAGFISGYHIYRDGVLVGTVKYLYFKDLPGDYEFHDYQVAAFNGLGEGPKSEIVSQKASIPAVAVVKRKVLISDFKQLVVNILRWTLSIGGALALFMIIVGGMMYMSSGGSEQRTVTARKTINYAIIGIILILLAYGISSLIEILFR